MRLNTLSPAEGSKRRVNARVVVSVLASVKPVVVVTKVRSLVLAVAYVAVSRVVRCLCTVVCRNSASLLAKQRLQPKFVCLTGESRRRRCRPEHAESGKHYRYPDRVRESDPAGEVTTPVTVRGLRVTKGARAAIEAAGGKIEE